MHESVEVITNEGRMPMELWFEPWGDSYQLPAGASLRLVGRSQREGYFEIVCGESNVVIYAWPGCTAKGHVGDQTVCSFDVAVPDIPEGMSMRGFVELLFGSRSDEKAPFAKAPRPWWKFW